MYNMLYINNMKETANIPNHLKIQRDATAHNKAYKLRRRSAARVSQ